MNGGLKNEKYNSVVNCSRATTGSLVVDEPSSVPELDTAALPDKAGKIAAKVDSTITRAEAAQLAFDLLSAENRDATYPLRLAGAR